MNFLKSAFVIKANGAALNMGEKGELKSYNSPRGKRPYLSAQWYRRILRDTATSLGKDVWQTSEIERLMKGETKGAQVFTKANPVNYADDDLFGYMRTLSTDRINEDGEVIQKSNVTRRAPLSNSQLLGVGGEIVGEFGVMSRQEGRSHPYSKNIYFGLFFGMQSIDLSRVGVFSCVDRAGERNIERAFMDKHVDTFGLDVSDNAISMSVETKQQRLTHLLEATMGLKGGANLSRAYNDVTHDFVLIAIVKGGNNLFKHAIGENSKGEAVLNTYVILDYVDVYKDRLITPIYVGFSPGFWLDYEEELKQGQSDKLIVCTVNEAYQSMIDTINRDESCLA